MKFVCKECGEEFNDHNYKKNRVYCSPKCQSKGSPPPRMTRLERKRKYWQDEKWLLEKYNNNVISLTKLSKKIGCSRVTLKWWLNHFKIRIKKKTETQSGENNPFYGKKHKDETKKKMSGYRESVCGENNPNWKGGCEPIYYGKNWPKQRSLARLRDRNICQNCGTKKNYECKNMDVHHIKKFKSFNNYKEANRLENLICLCSKCHTKIEKERY
jgi:hypothetical protein